MGYHDGNSEEASKEPLCIMGRILWRMVANVMTDWEFFLPIHKFADRLEK